MSSTDHVLHCPPAPYEQLCNRYCSNKPIRNYMGDQAGNRSLVFDLSITQDRFGSSSHVQQNGLLSHPQDLDDPLRLAAQRKINSYGQHCSNTLTTRTFLFSPPL